MANNIYIGNRYVPVFASPVEWDNLREYEPLTIVTYLGTAYTSRKTVPVGTSLDNTEYWVVTGNYNAQVEQYRQATVQLEAEVGTLTEKVNGFEDNIDTLNGDMATLKNTVNNTVVPSVTTLSELTQNLQKDVAIISRKKAVFIGDSYCTTSTGYTKALPQIIGDYLGLESVYNYAIGGAGYVNGSATQRFSGQVNTAIGALSESVRNEIGYVFILGGQNDFEHNIGDVSSESVTAITRAKEGFPNAKIVVLPLWYNKALSEATAQRFTVIYSNAHTYGCVTDDYSWSYLIDGSVTMMDNVHPSQISLNKMGGYIAGLVQGGSNFPLRSANLFNYKYSLFPNPVGATAWFDGQTIHIRGLLTAPAGGLTTQTELAKVLPCYAPREAMYFMCNTTTQGKGIQIGVDTNGVLKNYHVFGSGEGVFLNIDYPLNQGSTNRY